MRTCCSSSSELSPHLPLGPVHLTTILCDAAVSDRLAGQKGSDAGRSQARPGEKQFAHSRPINPTGKGGRAVLLSQTRKRKLGGLTAVQGRPAGKEVPGLPDSKADLVPPHPGHSQGWPLAL